MFANKERGEREKNFVNLSVSGADDETVTDVNVSYDSEDTARNDGNDRRVIQLMERQGSSVEGPPPPPPPLQPAVVVPNLEMEFPSPPRFGLNVTYV